jgi:hypothetical protein
LGIGGLTLALAGTSSWWYALDATRTLRASVDIPEAPAAPIKAVGAIPSPTSFDYAVTGLQPTPPRPQPPAVRPVAAIPTDASRQLPDDRNELN